MKRKLEIGLTVVLLGLDFLCHGQNSWERIDTLQKVEILDTCLLRALDCVFEKTDLKLERDRFWRLDFYQSSLFTSSYVVNGCPNEGGDKFTYYAYYRERYFFMTKETPAYLIKKKAYWQEFSPFFPYFREQFPIFSIYRDADKYRIYYAILE